ncbi:hypothetical protein EV181_004671, partial [Coemansia sp. RSA 532]
MYPFSSNVLLQDANNTLETLTLGINEMEVESFVSLGLFTQKYSNLTSVTLMTTPASDSHLLPAVIPSITISDRRGLCGEKQVVLLVWMPDDAPMADRVEYKAQASTLCAQLRHVDCVVDVTDWNEFTHWRIMARVSELRRNKTDKAIISEPAMVSIADLDNRIVGRIVNIACYGATGSSARLSTQAQLVGMASVSRTWHELVRPHLQSILIIECQPTPDAPQASNKNAKRRAAWKSPVINGNSSSKKSSGTCIWQTNAELVHLLQQHANGVSVPVSRLRVQSFDTAPDFTGFVAAMDHARLERCRLDTVTSLVVMEFIGASTAVSTAASTAVSTLDSHTGNGALLAAECIAKHAPNVRSMVCAPWNVSAAFRQLASPLSLAYLKQLHTLIIPLAAPLLSDSQTASSLTTLHIHAHILAASGPGIVPAQQLQVLRVHDAPAFFSWEAFASTGDSDQLEFASLTALGIDFASDNVVTTADFYSSINRTKSS